MQISPVPDVVEANSFEPLCRKIAARTDLAGAIETLLDGLAQEVKETSNDQNVQRLARRLRAQAPALAASVIGKNGGAASHGG